MDNVRVNKEILQQDIVNIFKAMGVPADDAVSVATVLIQTEQWGILSHGVLRVKRYVDCLASGGIKADAQFTITAKHGAWAMASANGGLGIPASVKATKLAISIAKEYTIGAVNVNQSHHNGAEGYYTNLCAQNGMAGIAMSTGNPIMAVTGSTEKCIGNNPFSYAVPAGKYGTIMLDIAMSAVADGKVQIARALNKKLEPGCILDANGKPSVEPDDYFNGGVLLPFGGHKGYGLAVMVECLAGIMSDAGLTHEINSWNEEKGKCGNTGHLFIAFDISKMLSLERFTSRVEQMVDQFKRSKRLPGVERILIPGEVENERLKKAGDTMEILPSTFNSLKEAAEIAGISLISAKQ